MAKFRTTTRRSTQPQIAAGAQTITAAKATESVTTAFTPVVVVCSFDVAGDVVEPTISGNVITFTRSTTVSAGTIYWIATDGAIA